MSTKTLAVQPDQAMALSGDEDRVSAIADRSSFGTTGGITISNLGEAVEFAKIMCQAEEAVPAKFRRKPGLCLGVTMQALRWGMDPFGVCQNAYVVNDKVAYEAKVIKAAIDERAPLAEPLDFEFGGEGATRFCRCIGKLFTASGSIVERIYETPPVSRIPTKNSPLWKSDVDQQLSYFAARSWARRHAPSVMLGVISRDEAVEMGSTINHQAREGGLSRRFLNAPADTDATSQSAIETVIDAFIEQAPKVDDLTALAETFDALQATAEWAEADQELQDRAREAQQSRARDLLKAEADEVPDDCEPADQFPLDMDATEESAA